ncbi:SCO6745 family protein [Streptomyces sp. IBSBF 2806]|uniref:SCO6745 family protein n=1 Tax=Streptomyces sp. IBSBF 2806 TaxID=2903529 RepID=UPI002FDC41B5
MTHDTDRDSLAFARETWRTVEPYHGAVYFSPEAAAQYAELGVDARTGYFASRSAALGAASADVVIATFYNFNPQLVRRAIPSAWDVATPQRFAAARLTGIDATLRRILGAEIVSSPEMVRAAELARAAAEVIVSHPQGRPLFAAHAALPWPGEPHLALWHAQTLLREFRGDGHVAALLTAGLSGIEALVTHAAAGDVDAGVLRDSRAWTAQQWGEAVQNLRERGWLDDGPHLALSEDGARRRAEIEHTTDRLAALPYLTLGPTACAELCSLVRPFSLALAKELLPWAVGRLSVGRP